MSLYYTIRQGIAGLYHGIVPAGLTMLLITAAAANFQISGMALFAPFFAAMAVFYWAVYWPSLMPKWFVLFLGLFHDILYALPLGITSLLLLTIWGVVVSQRRHLVNAPFLLLWVVFTLSAAVYVIVGWLLYSLYFWQIIFLQAILIQLVLTIALYPLIHKLFNMVHMGLLRR